MTTDRELTMLLVGDVFVRRDDPASIMQHIGERLRGADFTLGNLEGAFADSGFPMPKGASFRFNFQTGAKNMAAIGAAGFDAMGVANNHCLDFGYDALFETLAHLDRLGVAHAGSGRNKTEAYTPAIVERGGCRLALLAYTSVFCLGWDALDQRPGLAVIHARTAYEPPQRIAEHPGSPPIIRSWALPEDKQQLAEDIAKARTQADLVVCSFHWGVSERYTKLTDYQMEVGHHAIDSGADLVFGHHPHLLQAIEVYKGRPIFYSLGNFAFDLRRPELFDQETIVVRCLIRDRRITTVEYLPAWSDDELLNPRILDLEQGRRIVNMVEERSKLFGTRFVEAGEAMKLVLE